jgi:hypothetical protein
MNHSKNKNTITKESKSLIDVINDLTYNKVPYEKYSDIDKKEIIPFQINKFLSMNPYYIDVINQCQQYTVGILKPREVFKLYNDLLPKQKQFNKFIKAKKNTTKINDKLIKYFSDYYLCSKKEAEEYISLLSKKGDINAILNIVQKYGISKQDALKFLK